MGARNIAGEGQQSGRQCGSAAATVLPVGALTTAMPAAGCGFQVYVVHADASAGDDLQLLACFDYIAVDLGLTADDEGFVASDGVQQLGGASSPS